jgi:2-phosphoglycerate kinase
LLRSFDQEKESKLLWASSYYAAGAGGKDHDEIIRGYEAQNQLMLDTLDKMISVYFQRNESLVIEVFIMIFVCFVMKQNSRFCLYREWHYQCRQW